MSKFFKGLGKKKDTKEAPVPRDNKAIIEQYNQLKARAGEVQYHVYALTKELEQLNGAMESLSYESAARQKLDKEAQETTPQANA